MNTYKKFCPNVYVARCEQEYTKGEEIIVTTRRGKENACIVHNLIADRDGIYYYSITRLDGFNLQTRAQKKADKLKEWADSANEKSNNYYEAAQKDGDFLGLGEPIKIGHHSEKRHRKAFDDAHRNMSKSVALSEKAKQHNYKAEVWEERVRDINLSIPESLEYFKAKLKEAEEHHKALKDGTKERRHSHSLTYANKEKKEMKRKYDIAVTLWG